MFQKLEDKKLNVTFEGKDYEILYSISRICVAVEIRLNYAINCKKTTEVVGVRTMSTARQMALEILRDAKQRGQLA